jgi:glycosyltransferase involved in cell wall biosynthesis
MIKNSHKILSIITVVYNDENHIENTILNVLSQKIEEVEYIVIDGASSDHTLNIINKYKNNIDLIVSEKDNGIYDAINKGIKLSNGKIIGILNSGDFYNNNTISNILKYYSSTYADIIYGDLYTFEDFKNHTFKNIRKANHKYLYKNMSIFHPSTFISKNTYDIVGFYDLNFKLASDYDFLLKCFYLNLNFYYVNYCFTYFFLNGISFTNQGLLISENINIKRKYYNSYRLFFYKLQLHTKYYFFKIRKILILFFLGESIYIILKNYKKLND